MPNYSPDNQDSVPTTDSVGGPHQRRRRLSVSTVTAAKDKTEGIFSLVDSPQSCNLQPSDPNTGTTMVQAQWTNNTIDLNTATAAITRDETLSNPKYQRKNIPIPTSNSRRSSFDPSQESKRQSIPTKPSAADDATPFGCTTPNAAFASKVALSVNAQAAGPSPKRGRRLSVSGRIAPGGNTEDDYQLKEVAIKHSNDFHIETIKEQLVDMGIGYACHKGLKPESPNQDDFFLIRIDDWGLYGVFDGHGPFGHDVSNFVQREFPKQLYGPDFLSAAPEKISEVMINGFHSVQKRLQNYCDQPNVRTCCSLSGSTASIVYHRIKEKRLIVAHVGDSRVVIGRRCVDGSMEAEDLAKDHKPDNEEERKRINECGGVVKRIAGDVPHRVFLQGKMFPGLAMSRALGDLVGHKAGVICTPEVMDYHIQDQDEFLILASDGIWEFITSEECVEKISQHPISELSKCVEEICSEAWKRWKDEEGNVVDDITLEVVYLK